MKLTNTEIQELRFVLRSMVSWGEGGCYGDGENITDKRGFARAKKILAKLEAHA